MPVIETKQSRPQDAERARETPSASDAQDLNTSSFSTTARSETQTTQATPSLETGSLSVSARSSSDWREVLQQERKGQRRGLTLVSGTSPLAPDAALSPEMGSVVWLSLRSKELLFHGTSTDDLDTLRTSGIAKHLAVVSTGDVQRYSDLYRQATGLPFALSGDFTSTKTFVSMTRGNAEEFTTRPGGETAQRMRESAALLLASGRISAEDKAWLREVSGRIEEYSANARPVVIGISGAALELLHPNDPEANGARGQEFVQQQMSFALGTRGTLSYQGFLNHLSTDITELSLSRVRPTDIVGVYPLAA